MKKVRLDFAARVAETRAMESQQVASRRQDECADACPHQRGTLNVPIPDAMIFG